MEARRENVSSLRESATTIRHDEIEHSRAGPGTAAVDRLVYQCVGSEWGWLVLSHLNASMCCKFGHSLHISEVAAAAASKGAFQTRKRTLEGADSLSKNLGTPTALRAAPFRSRRPIAAPRTVPAETNLLFPTRCTVATNAVLRLDLRPAFPGGFEASRYFL